MKYINKGCTFATKKTPNPIACNVKKESSNPHKVQSSEKEREIDNKETVNAKSEKHTN